ncbi:MAG: hypothetical protein E7539_05835 [Ruminococcaceae bacterium]|nr:hypothetical protein [Oscillospiraceae bacterium]
MIRVLLFGLEVLFCALVIFICKKFLKNTIGKIATPILAAIFIFCLFVANSWVQKMPIVYDEVGIVALGQKNEQSQGVDVSFCGVGIRGKKQDFPEISEGKWFFTTEENYMWRPHYDSRQPEGTTDSIVVKVPVGTARTLLFKKTVWGGLAQVGFWDQKVVIDTNTTSQIELKDSGIKRQLLQAAGRFAIFGVIICAFALVIYAFCRISQSKNEKIKSKAVYAGIALGFFAVSVSYLETQELWLDEMFQIGFSGTGKSLYETLMVTETTPPIFRLIANVWYNIVPYGEKWLLMLPTLFSAAFVYVTGLLGEQIGGKYVGFASAVLSAFSTALLVHGVREFRANSLLALLSAVFLLYYVKRLKTGKYAVAFSLVMILLAYTHYFGVFLCGAVFLLDVYYFFCKKKKLKDFIPYIVAGFSYIPWMFRFLQLGQLGLTADWQLEPTFSAVYNLLLYLCSTVTLMVFFVSGIVFTFLDKKQEKTSFDARFSLMFIAFVMIACLYAYGTFIRPQATLWTHRYFLNILPCIIAITAYGMVWIGRFVLSAFKRLTNDFKATGLVKKAVCILLVMFLAFTNMPKISASYTPPHNQDYKGAAETIYGHVDAYSYDSLVVFLCQDYVVDGWYEYYMTMQGKRDDIDYASVTKIPSEKEAAEEFFANYETIYQCYLQEYLCPSFTQQINEHYELVENNTSTCVRIYKRID